MSDKAHSEDFPIGVFSSREEAENTAHRYLTELPGFRDYPCVSHIEEIPYLSPEDLPDGKTLWQGEGWNTDENFDETDILKTPFLPTCAEAEAEMRLLQARFSRAEWAIQKYCIGQSFWPEGFDRD